MWYIAPEMKPAHNPGCGTFKEVFDALFDEGWMDGFVWGVLADGVLDSPVALLTDMRDYPSMTLGEYLESLRDDAYREMERRGTVPKEGESFVWDGREYAIWRDEL